MKRFFILLFGLCGGLLAGFFGSDYIEIAVDKGMALINNKTAQNAENYNDYDVSEEEVINEDKVLPEGEYEVVGLTETGIEVKQVKEEQPVAKVLPEPKEEKIPEMKDKTHGKKGIAATIDGRNITVDEIRYTYDANPQIKEKVPFEEFYKKAVHVYVEGKLIYDAALAADVTATDDYKKQIELLKQDIARKVYVEKSIENAVNDAAIKKLYADYKRNFIPQKEIKAKHILVDRENLAKEVIAKLGEGRKFEDLAEQYSKEPADLGYFTKDMMIPEFGDAAFALKKGEYSKEPVKSQYGYHVILVEEIRDSKPASFEDAAPQLKQMMTSKVLENLYSGVKKGKDIVVYSYDGKVVPFEGSK